MQKKGIFFKGKSAIFFLLEPQTLHILYIIHTNLAKLIRTEKKHLMACSSFEHKT